MPLRVWDTFVSDQTTFGLAILYATDHGVKVIEGADGGLYHSAFTERASEYAYQHGVAQVFSGDDLNTGNHNYPANYSHTMLIQGTVGRHLRLGDRLRPGGGAQFLGAPRHPARHQRPDADPVPRGGHDAVRRALVRVDDRRDRARRTPARRRARRRWSTAPALRPGRAGDRSP